MLHVCAFEFVLKKDASSGISHFVKGPAVIFAGLSFNTYTRKLVAQVNVKKTSLIDEISVGVPSPADVTHKNTVQGISNLSLNDNVTDDSYM